MITKSHARVAAWTAAVILAVNAGLNFYVALGGDLGGVSDDAGAPVVSGQVDALLAGLGTLLYAGVLLVLVGYWRDRVPVAVARFARLTGWLIVLVPLAEAGRYFSAPVDVVGGLICLVIALLAFVVARSEVPGSLLHPFAGQLDGRPRPGA